jgi:hypothetical protein
VRTVVVAAALLVLAVVAVRVGGRDDLPWVVWKLEGTAERGATALPVLRVAARPDGEAIDGDWRVAVYSTATNDDGTISTFWETLERPRSFAALWRWWGRRTDRFWLALDCTYAEYGETVTTSSGRWRQFVREPFPGDTWCRRPDPALAGRWRGSFVEPWPHRSSDLDLRPDGSVGGLVDPPGSWGVRDDVLVLTWGEGTLNRGSWQGRRTGPSEIEGFYGAEIGCLVRE